jgi:hypothetical protein
MYKYDFGLSFAGEDRQYAQDLADRLRVDGINIFYDRDEEAELWGQDLYQRFQKIYGEECRFFIPFISSNYLAKKWPKHELKQAQARDFKSDIEYILPLRLDDSLLPGLNETTGYIDLREKSISEVAELCAKKLVSHSPVRKLYIFLRCHNQDVVPTLSSRPSSILIRVATNRKQELDGILFDIDESICIGQDSHSTMMNGGFDPQGCFASQDPEPHTTYTISLFSKFYDNIWH